MRQRHTCTHTRTPTHIHQRIMCAYTYHARKIHCDMFLFFYVIFVQKNRIVKKLLTIGTLFVG